VCLIVRSVPDDTIESTSMRYGIMATLALLVFAGLPVTLFLMQPG